MKVYRTSEGFTIIEELEAHTVTENTVKLVEHDGSLSVEPKKGAYSQYHDSWEEAKSYLIKTQTAKIRQLEESLEKQSSKLLNIRIMENPNDPHERR